MAFSAPSGSGSQAAANGAMRKTTPLLAPSRFSFGGSGAEGASSASGRNLAFPGFKESKLSAVMGSIGGNSAATEKNGKDDSKSAPAKACFLPLSGASGTRDSEKAQEPPSEPAAPPPAAAKTTAAASSAGFVFGQNFSDRAENYEQLEKQKRKEQEEKKEQPAATSKEAPESQDTVSTESAGEEAQKSEAGSATTAPAPSLNESAAAYVESHLQKRPLDSAPTPQRTGEEEERNVCQLNAKLYVFDKSGACWQERGRGCLRLNDSQTEQAESRLVMRTAGSLRLILNSKLFPAMTVESPSDKNIRLTGYDEEGQVRIFLISSGAKDIAVLFRELRQRLNKLKASEGSSEQKEASKRKSGAADQSEEVVVEEKKSRREAESGEEGDRPK